jgi:hypothetical protein
VQDHQCTNSKNGTEWNVQETEARECGHGAMKPAKQPELLVVNHVLLLRGVQNVRPITVEVHLYY